MAPARCPADDRAPPPAPPKTLLARGPWPARPTGASSRSTGQLRGDVSSGSARGAGAWTCADEGAQGGPRRFLFDLFIDGRSTPSARRRFGEKTGAGPSVSNDEREADPEPAVAEMDGLRRGTRGSFVLGRGPTVPRYVTGGAAAARQVHRVTIPLPTWLGSGPPFLRPCTAADQEAWPPDVGPETSWPGGLRVLRRRTWMKKTWPTGRRSRRVRDNGEGLSGGRTFDAARDRILLGSPGEGLKRGLAAGRKGKKARAVRSRSPGANAMVPRFSGKGTRTRVREDHDSCRPGQ